MGCLVHLCPQFPVSQGYLWLTPHRASVLADSCSLFWVRGVSTAGTELHRMGTQLGYSWGFTLCLWTLNTLSNSIYLPLINGKRRTALNTSWRISYSTEGLLRGKKEVHFLHKSNNHSTEKYLVNLPSLSFLVCPGNCPLKKFPSHDVSRGSHHCYIDAFYSYLPYSISCFVRCVHAWIKN